MTPRIFTDEQKQRRKEAATRHREKNREKHRAAVRTSRKKRLETDPDYYKKVDLKRMYGVTLAWYSETLAAQNFSCAICKLPENENTTRAGKPLRLSVDHCHSHGQVRGLLCNNCNRALGMFGDNTKVLASAIAYLSKGLT